MGAYENPVLIVDTETPRIYANAISNLGKQASSAIEKEIASRNAHQQKLQKEKEEMLKRGMDDQDEVKKLALKAGINNPQQWDLLYEVTNEFTLAGTDVLKSNTLEGSKAASKRRAIASQKQSQIIMNATLYKESAGPDFRKHSENLQNWGNQGNLSMSAGKNYEYILANTIRDGINEGKEEIKFNENNEQKSLFTGEYLKSIGYPDGIEWDTALLNAYDPVEIPNVDNKISSMYQMYNAEKNPGGLSILDKTNQLAEGYYDVENPRIINLPDGRRQTVYPVLADKVNAATKGVIDSQIAGLLANPEAAKSVWKDIFNKESNLEPATDGTSSKNSIFSKADTLEFGKLYEERAKSLSMVPEVKYGDAYTPPKNTGGDGGTDKSVNPVIKNEIDAFISNPYALLKKTTVFKESLAVIDPLDRGNPKQVTLTKKDAKGNAYTPDLFDLTDPAEKERLFNEWLDRQGYKGEDKLKAKEYFLKNNSTLPIF